MKPVVAIVLLAAGMSRRMGAHSNHKLLALFEGVPLVRRSAIVALESDAKSVIVVVGDRQQVISDVLNDLALTIVLNPDYASGLASSLKAGFGEAVSNKADGVLIMLADMPGLTANDLNRLTSAFYDAGGNAIVRAVACGKPGNPVILPRVLSKDVSQLEGDVGARDLIRKSEITVIDVEIGPAASLDVDTPEAVQAAGGIF